MKTFLGLLSAFGAVVLAIFYQKAKTNEACIENMQTKEKLLEKDKVINSNNTALSNEEQKRMQLEDDIKRDKNEEDPTANISDFFNKRK